MLFRSEILLFKDVSHILRNLPRRVQRTSPSHLHVSNNREIYLKLFIETMVITHGAPKLGRIATDFDQFGFVPRCNTAVGVAALHLADVGIAED